jgi:hypothetical protein
VNSVFSRGNAGQCHRQGCEAPDYFVHAFSFKTEVQSDNYARLLSRSVLSRYIFYGIRSDNRVRGSHLGGSSILDISARTLNELF